MSFLNMSQSASFSLSERLFNAITSFPEWLESFDALNIPTWAVFLSVTIGIAGFIFAIREFLSWFLKTNSIVDEVVRLKTLVRDLQGDLAALESTVARLQSTASTASEEAATPSPLKEVARVANATSPTRQFRLDN